MHIIKSITSSSSTSKVRLLRKHPASQRIAFSTQQGMYLIDWHEIERCEADGNYTKVHLKGATVILVSKTLLAVETALPHSHFVRVHQSHLVRMQEIRLAARDHIQLMSGVRLPVSRSKRNELQDLLSSQTIEV